MVALKSSESSATSCSEGDVPVPVVDGDPLFCVGAHHQSMYS